jgi:glycosyltransferase involved in cell wall biosynthesis
MRFVPTVLCLDATQVQLASLADWYGFVPPGDSFYDRAVRWINRRVYHDASAMLVWSTWVERSLVSDYGVDPATVVVVPNGVDLAHWRPAEPERRSAGDPVRVLFVGGDFARKGGPLLLEALRTIDLPWELHLVTGVAVPEATGDARVRVHRGLTSNAPELVDLYRRCDLFALPTLGDCYSLAAIEAMASGLPVVTTAVGGIPDVVAEGETGFLVPTGDAAALQGALRRLLEDGELRRRQGTAGRRRAEALFDARQCAATMHRVVRAVHAQGRNFRWKRDEGLYRLLAAGQRGGYA